MTKYPPVKSIHGAHKHTSFKHLLYVNPPNQGSEPKAE